MISTTWFADARFGLFIHWGLYALPAGEWKGAEVDYIGEWLQHGERIPNEEYARLASRFAPNGFDALAWVRAAKAAGMGYVVFTAKHHDGFAMFHSASDPFNVVDATPWRRDPLAELAAACRAEGLRLGIYYSHCVDWCDAHAGTADLKDAGRMWGNDWEFPPGNAVGFSHYLERKVMPQLTELLSNYGTVALLWFDTPIATLTREQAQRIHDLVRRLQPDCLIGNRIGHDFGDIDGLGDNQAPSRPCRRASEACVTLNETWGYKAHDHAWKSPAQVIALLAACAAKDCNLLLNIGPDSDGRFPAPALNVLTGISQWMEPHSASVLGTRGSPFPVDPPGCVVTRSHAALHVIALDPTVTEIDLSGLQPAVASITLTPAIDDLPRVATIPLPATATHDGLLREQGGIITLPAHRGQRRDGTGWEGWCQQGDSVGWTFRVDLPGRFTVQVGCGGCDYHTFNGGHRIRLMCGTHILSGLLTADDLLQTLHSAHYPESRTRLGDLNLSAGDHQIELQIEQIGSAGHAWIPRIEMIR